MRARGLRSRIRIGCLGCRYDARNRPFECELHLPHAPEAIRGIERRRPRYDARQRPFDPQRLILLLVAGIVRVLPGQTEQQQLAERVHVAAHIGLAEPELLRRRIGARPEMRRVRLRVSAPQAGDTEIDDDGPPAPHDDVRWLQVTMDKRRGEAIVQRSHRVA